MKSLIKQARRPDVKFFRDGRIYITARVARDIGLEDTDAIDVACDNGKYYLYVARKKAPGGYVARCHSMKKGSRFMRCNSRDITDGILKAVGVKDRAYLLAGNPELLPEIGRFAVTINVNNNLHLGE